MKDEYSLINKENIDNAMSYCRPMIQQLKDIRYEMQLIAGLINAGEYVNSSKIDNLKEQARILRKRIGEYIATIESISDKLKYDLLDFADTPNLVNKKATYLTDNFDLVTNNQASISIGEEISDIAISFMNTGYISWTHGVQKLRITISNNELITPLIYDFDIPQETTVPITQSITFIATIIVPQKKGIYDMDFMITDSSDWNYGSHSKELYVTV